MDGTDRDWTAALGPPTLFCANGATTRLTETGCGERATPWSLCNYTMNNMKRLLARRDWYPEFIHDANGDVSKKGRIAGDFATAGL